jgi:hypothetical protein
MEASFLLSRNGVWQVFGLARDEELVLRGGPLAATIDADGRSGAAELRECQWVWRWGSEWEVRLSIAHAWGKAVGEATHMGEERNHRRLDGNGGRRRRPRSGEGGRWHTRNARIRPSGPWARPSWVILGRFQLSWAILFLWTGPSKLFSIFHRLSKYSNQIKLVKYEQGNSKGPKISKLCKGVDLNIVNNFAHWHNFIFSLDFMYKFGNKLKFESSLNFKGVQTFGEKFHKFSKNLSWHDLQAYEFRLAHLYKFF